jgi:hypothetical protein
LIRGYGPLGRYLPIGCRAFYLSAIVFVKWVNGPSRERVKAVYSNLN